MQHQICCWPTIEKFPSQPIRRYNPVRFLLNEILSRSITRVSDHSSFQPQPDSANRLLAQAGCHTGRADGQII
jgi:hypothetical protein